MRWKAAARRLRSRSSSSPASRTRPPTAPLAERVAKHLETLTAGKGEDFGKLRAELAAKIAESSATASRLTEELVRLDGRARDLIEQKLGVEADRLAASEQQLRDLERDAAELEIARKDHAWSVAALRDFAKVQEHVARQPGLPCGRSSTRWWSTRTGARAASS
ncbi:MAG: hypothetical protein IPG04_17435 [Polyangiaceae bacterium]|nr:hypothetical protein [Polyangiaceae bacterium]